MTRLPLLVIFILASPAAAQYLAPFGSLQCVEVGGNVAEWEGLDRVTESRPGEWRSFEIRGVDLARGSALFIGDQGSVQVGAIPLEESMTFIQMPFAGDQEFTTVFYPTREQDFYFFVHSRHASSRTPVVSQTHGFCAILE